MGNQETRLYVVFENVEGHREFVTLGRMTLAEAEQVAYLHNDTGSYLIATLENQIVKDWTVLPEAEELKVI